MIRTEETQNKFGHRTGYVARIGGAEGTGKTVTEARKNALHVAEENLSGVYTPRMIRAGEFLCILWRAPVTGWHYGILDVEKQKDHTENSPYLYGNATGEDEKGTERSARRHLAQYLFGGARDGGYVILDERDKADHASWVRWQRAYATAKAEGKSDEEARRVAG